MVIYIISPRIFWDQLILQQIRVNLNIFGGNEYNLREKKVVSMNGKSQFCEWRHGAMAARLRRAERSYSMFRVRGGGLRRSPSSTVRSSGWLRGTGSAYPPTSPHPGTGDWCWWSPSDSRGQGLRPRGTTPPPRSCCVGSGGPRGATPRSRSGGAAVRRSPSSTVRSSGCALLEQPWRDTPRPR